MAAKKSALLEYNEDNQLQMILLFGQFEVGLRDKAIGPDIIVEKWV